MNAKKLPVGIIGVTPLPKCGTSKQLYCYTDFTHEGTAFAANPSEWRELTSKSGSPVRAAVRGVPIPIGYMLNGAGLACDGIVRRERQNVPEKYRTSTVKLRWP